MFLMAKGSLFHSFGAQPKEQRTFVISKVSANNFDRYQFTDVVFVLLFIVKF